MSAQNAGISMTQEKESLRQQMMLRALLNDARPGVVAGWMRDGEGFARGLAAYRANAGALAERALTAAYPTLAELLGDEAFAGLARAFWQRQPPARGDIAQWGAALPAFVADENALADEPYLADVARLDWAIHLAARAADDSRAPSGLERLSDADPSTLRLVPRRGTALVESPHPIATIVLAHRSDAKERFTPVRAAFTSGEGEAALVWREGWAVRVAALPPAQVPFTRAVLRGADLDHSLKEAGPQFDFEAWLLAALRTGWLAGAEVFRPTPEGHP